MQRMQYETLERLTDTTSADASVTGLAHLPASLLRTLRIWNSRVRQRKHLGELDNRLLKDMGLTRHDVHNELRKPFWMR